METKTNFKSWFSATNKQIALAAFRFQWIKVITKDNPLFTVEELMSFYGSQNGFGEALVSKPELVPQAIETLRAAKKVPVAFFDVLIDIATNRLTENKDIVMIRNFVAEQNFVGAELNTVIYSILCSVDRMPEWKDCGLQFISMVEQEVNFCVMLREFLTHWGRLDETSNELVTAAFKKILPEWAPLLTKALNQVSGQYRYELSLALFRRYFSLEEVNAIVECFNGEGNAVLQQRLLDGMFNYLNMLPREQIGNGAAEALVKGVSRFLIENWADNCFKFSKFWEKFNYSPEFFQLVRRAFGSDMEMAKFDAPSPDELAKLKTPLHMLYYLPVAQNSELCLLLLRIYAYGTKENQNLAARILSEKETALMCSGAFENYRNELQQLMKLDHRQEMGVFVSAFVNSLLEHGSEVGDIAELQNFIRSNDLNVPSLYEVYGKQLEVLANQRRKEQETLRFLKSI